MEEAKNLNPDALQRLHRLGDNAFVIKMIDLFIEYAGTKVAEACAAQAAGDLEGVQRAVHPIKSSAGNVGACRVQELAQRIEDLAQHGPSERLAAMLPALEQAFEAVKHELAARRDSLSPPAEPGATG